MNTTLPDLTAHKKDAHRLWNAFLDLKTSILDDTLNTQTQKTEMLKITFSATDAHIDDKKLIASDDTRNALSRLQKKMKSSKSQSWIWGAVTFRYGSFHTHIDLNVNGRSVFENTPINIDTHIPRFGKSLFSHWLLQKTLADEILLPKNAHDKTVERKKRHQTQPHACLCWKRNTNNTLPMESHPQTLWGRTHQEIQSLIFQSQIEEKWKTQHMSWRQTTPSRTDKDLETWWFDATNHQHPDVMITKTDLTFAQHIENFQNHTSV